MPPPIEVERDEERVAVDQPVRDVVLVGGFAPPRHLFGEALGDEEQHHDGADQADRAVDVEGHAPAAGTGEEMGAPARTDEGADAVGDIQRAETSVRLREK